MDTVNRIKAFRDAMKKYGLDYYIIPTSDAHMSEYICPHYEGRMFISGFSGDAGTLIIGLNDAYLWTDGRFFTQAEKQLDGSGIELVKMGEEGTPTIYEFLEKTIKKGMKLGTSGYTIDAKTGLRLKDICDNNKAKFKSKRDLLDDIWDDRPNIEYRAINTKFAKNFGNSAAEKITVIKDELKKSGMDGILLSKLDEVMYTFNIRGRDIAYNPVAFSYGYIDNRAAVLFVHSTCIDDELIMYAKENGFKIMDYENVVLHISEIIPKDYTVGVCEKYINYSVYKSLAKHCSIKMISSSVVDKMKAVKSDEEIELIRHYFLLDSAALTMALREIDEKINDGEKLSETDVSDIILKFRSRIEGFIEESFPTIAAYGPNGAVIHYVPEKGNCARLEERGLIVIDSGGQYPCATTDVTRTVVLGQISKEEKEAFTQVSLGMLELMNSTFAKGCCGRNLDILARRRLWEVGKNFNHGTGHGVGCCLNVHEGPHSIRYRHSASDETAEFKPGMLITDEPGFYEPGKFGVRTENTLLVIEKTQSEYGKFYGFESLTVVPLDIRAFDKSIMSQEEIDMVNNYQKNVFNKIKAYIDDKTIEWLNSRLYL